MILFDKTRRSAVTSLGIAMVIGLLSTGGCSDVTGNSSSGSGDKRDDPALKASMKGAMDMLKAKSQAAKKVQSLGGKRRG
jgi:hypothetical protein